MASVGIAIIGCQSQGGAFTVNTGSVKEAALSAWTRSGRDQLTFEINRRLPSWTASFYASVAANIGAVGAGSTGAGGSSWIDDTIDPTVAPGDDTPLSGNSDARLTTAGQTYMASLDTILGNSHDAWIVIRYGYTFDIQEAKGTSKVNQCRAEKLWWGLVDAKLAAKGTPYRMSIVPPGLTDRGDLMGHYIGMLHETALHMAGGNGYRSDDPDIAGFAAISGLYVDGGSQCYVANSHANEADNLAPDAGIGVADYTHQSVGGSVRLANQLGLIYARWLDSSTPQEFDGQPRVTGCTWDAGNSRVRVKFAITAGNRLVWSPRPAADATNFLLEAGANTAPYYYGHILLHAHALLVPDKAYQRIRPARIAIDAIAVDNTSAASGIAYLDLTLPAGITPTRGTCFSIFPSKYGRHYWRRTEAIAANLKLLDGLWEEAGVTPYTVTAACEDILAGQTMMFPVPVANFPVAV